MNGTLPFFFEVCYHAARLIRLNAFRVNLSPASVARGIQRR